ERRERRQGDDQRRQDTNQDGQTGSHHRAGCLNQSPREVQSPNGCFPESALQGRAHRELIEAAQGAASAAMNPLSVATPGPSVQALTSRRRFVSVLEAQ